MNKLIALMVSVVMAGTTFAGATTHFALDTRSGMRLATAGSNLEVDYSPHFSTVLDEATVRVLTNGVVWVESAVGGTKDFIFGDTGLYQFTHQVLADGVVAEEMSAFYAITETGRVDIPDTWTEIPDGMFKNCDWLTSVTIPSSVTNIASTAFAGCSNVVSVTLGCGANVAAPGFYEAEFRGMNSFDGSCEIKANARAMTLSAAMLSADTTDEYTMYAYAAFMWFEGGITYHFSAQYDDRSSVKVDDTMVISPGSDCTKYSGVISFGRSGWHWLELRGWNRTGQGALNHGVNDGFWWWTSADSTKHSFADSGDGSLFCVKLGCACLPELFPDSYANIRDVAVNDGTVEVPAGMFSGCAALESVTIPNGVTNFGANAFEGCAALGSIVLPTGLKSIGSDAFAGCMSLTRVDVSSIEDWLNIGFENEAANPLSTGAKLYVAGVELTELEIPEGVTDIEGYAFSGGAFTSVTIPNNVMNIAPTAFVGCSNIVDVVMGERGSSWSGRYYRLSIRRTAAESEVQLSEFSLYDSAGQRVNLSLTQLADGISPSDLLPGTFSVSKSFSYGSYSYYQTSEKLFDGSADTKMCICNDINLSAASRPEDWWVLSLLLADNVDQPFEYSLTTADDCPNRDPLDWTLESSVDGVQWFCVDEQIGVGAPLARKTEYGRNKMGADGTVMSLFSDSYTKIRMVRLMDGASFIARGEFEGCVALESVTIPSSVRNILGNAFAGCENLKHVNVPSVEDWLKIKFANDAANPLCCGAELHVSGEKIVDLVVPGGIGEIGEGAFKGCSGLRSVAIPSSVTNVAATAFVGCSNIVSVAFRSWPDMLHQCEPEASGWSAVGDDVYRTDRQNQYDQTLVLKTEVDGPRRASFRWKATYSGNYLRYYIDGVQQADLRYSSADWQEVQIDVPAGRHEVKWEYYNSSNYGDYYGWVDLSGWSYYAPAKVSSVFPDSYASIQRVTFGSDVRNLGEDAFLGCESLKRVDVASIEDWLKIKFANAAANPLSCGAELYVGGMEVTQLVVPVGESEIGAYAFAGGQFTSVTIPSSVTNIGENAFVGCENLKRVDVESVEDWLKIKFANAVANPLSCGAELHVGGEKIVDLVVPEGIGEIGEHAFAGYGIDAVLLPSSLTNVAPTAFAGCSNIVSVEFGAWPNMLHQCEPETLGWSVDGNDVYRTDRQDQYYQTLVLKTEIEGPRHASFRWKATYSGNYLRYYIDGVQQSNLRYSSADWQEVQFDVPAGRHEVKWEYYNSSNYGDYYGWVDLSGWSYYAPDKVSRIFPDSYASIQRVVLGNGVTNLCEDAFLGCESLKRVDVVSMADWLKIKFANAVANPLSCGAELYVGGEKIVDLVVPEGIGDVGEYAFAGYGVGRVTLSSSVTNVAPTAFVGCANITNVVLHGGVSTERQIVPELVEGTAWIEEPETLDGDKVYKSNVINHNQSTAIEFEISEGMEQIVFMWKVGSENNYDWLTWYLDDVQNDRISGSHDWVALTNELDGTAHRLKFIYSKDGSQSTPPDCGWVSVHASGINPPKVKDMFPDSPLVGVTIGDEVEALPDDFFVGCETLEVVRLPAGFEMSQETWDSLSDKACVRMSYGGVVWNLNNRGAIWPEDNCKDVVEVPASLGGLDVAKITDDAFAGCEEITALKVPEGDVAIGDGAFAGCVNLKSLILNNRFDLTGMTLRTLLPDGIAVLERLALGGAHAVLPDGFFDGCTSLSSIVLPETLEDFGDNDVREIGRRGGKSGLWVQDGWVLGYIGTAPAEVTIPDGVKGIAAHAFEGQYDLERVVLPESLKFIGKDAFAGCTSLEALDLPEGCGRIDDGAFRDCTWIQEVSLASGLTNIGAAAFANCAGLSVLIAPEGLKAMGEGAFSNCWRMVSASLPVSLDEVGSNCFWNCKNLSGVTVPTHVQPLKTMFPAAYDALTSIVIAEGEGRLVEGVFDGCATVREIVLPESVTEIPAAAFRDCVSLERMAFPAAVKEIGDEAFAGCVGLTRLNLPAGLEAIGARAFEGLSELEQVAIPDGVTAIGSGAFAGCGAVRQVRLPGNVTTLTAAFPDAYEKIVRAEVPEGTTELIAGLFDGCAALESFTIPASVTDIGARAFAGCGALKAVALPQGLKTIGDAAFSGVSGILELEIPSSVGSLGAGAFTGCAALRSVTLPGDAGTLADIFPDAYKAMVLVTVTEGTETLNDGFFAGCVSLKTVELPTSVAVIGAGAFEDCTSLASVGIPAGVTSLGVGAFRGCSALAEVTLPGGLGVLENEVFADCALLTSITVPESVTTLGSRVFDGCTALRLVKFIGNAPQVAADAYAGTPGELVTQVATGSRGWDGIATSRNLPEFWPSGTTHGIGWWDPNRFEVTFDYNDGSGMSETVEEITDTTYRLPDADPVHPGAAFLGWWTETVNGARVTPVTRVMRTSAHTLYAHWRPFSYTVTFDANGGTGTMEEQAMTVDEPANLPSRGFVRINYDFAGWALEPEGDVAFADGEEVVNLSTMDGGTVRLYAVWVEREWSAADYLGVQGMVFTTDGDADWFPDVETSHDGLGSMRSGEIGIADAGETTRSTLRTTVAGKGTLTFWWKVNCEGPDPDYGDLYDYLEFTVDGERPEAVEPIAGDVDWMKVEVRIEGETPTHELAWSFVKDDWDEEALPDIAWVDELTWTPDPVTVTFDGNGATEGSVPAAVTSAAGVELVLPNAGTLRKGPCKFVGWSDGKRIYVAGETYVVGSADVTLSAVWDEFTIADALNATDLVFTTGGDEDWIIDFETSHDGEASMRSGAVGTSQTSWIETKVNGAGTLTFVWKSDGLLNRGKPANYVQYVLDDGVPVQVAVADWTSVEVEVEGAGAHTVCWTYLHTRAQTTGADCAWLDEVTWVVAELPKPTIDGDEGATVTGDAETGFVIKPSEEKTAVEVTIPGGIDAGLVTVEVSPKVESVKPNGAKVKIVSGGADITELLNMPAADGNGVVDLTKAKVKEEYVKEALDPAKGAVIELCNGSQGTASPTITTAPTRVGLFYQLREGETLEGMKGGDSKFGDGEPWTPEIKVKGGSAAFYSIGVGKGE